MGGRMVGWTDEQNKYTDNIRTIYVYIWIDVYISEYICTYSNGIEKNVCGGIFIRTILWDRAKRHSFFFCPDIPVMRIYPMGVENSKTWKVSMHEDIY